MKKFSIIAVIATLFAISCSQFEQTDTMPTISVGPERYYATFGDETKTFVESNKYLRWHAEDEISVFPAHTTNIPYLFEGETGDNNGSFKSLATDEVVGSPLNYTYAIYPYNTTTTISTEGVLSVILPSTQQYAQNSFGRGANTSVAITDNISSDRLYFKNACGFLKLRLYGEVLTVKSVTLRGNNNEKIAGAATISVDANGTPTTTMSENATTAVTIVCDEGVTLGASVDESVEFWFVLPEVTFTKGFTVFVSGEEREMKQSTSNSITIERNKILPMETLLVVPNITIANRKIYYTSSDGKVVKPNKSDVFGANIISNTYENGQGVIEFDGEVTKIGGSAFYNCSRLIGVTIPESVTSIGASAFYGCTKLTGVTIPDNVTEIGGSAFYNCDAITKITIPKGVTVISSKTFSSCNKLTSITFGGGITEIGDDAFNSCTVLTGVVIPNTVVTIGKQAFQQCDALTSIAIPDSVLSLGANLFYGCDKLESATIGKNVATIGSSTFYGCTKLASIAIPDSVTEIGASAFVNCSGLTEVHMSKNVVSLGDNAFSGCSGLTAITLPESLTSIGSSAFSGCTLLTSITIPSKITTIMSYTFSGCSELSEISLPNGVISIGDNAFYNCKGLTTFTIPDSVTEVGGSVFEGCSKLVSVIIGANTLCVGNYMFRYCSELSKVSFRGTNVETIGNYAFVSCPKLTEISLPEGVKKIGSFAFKGSVISNIVLPSTLVSINSSAFTSCTKLQKIVIPNNVETISREVFRGCTSLVEVVFGSSLKTIGMQAFAECSALTEVEIPNSTESIGDSAFHSCKSLKKFSASNVAQYGNSVFENCTNLEEAHLGNNISTWANYVFRNCTSLRCISSNLSTSDNRCVIVNKTLYAFAPGGIESYDIPSGVTKLADDVFLNHANLKEINLPEGLLEIGAGAFQNCTGISSITMPRSLSKVGSNAFKGKSRIDIVIHNLRDWFNVEHGTASAGSEPIGCPNYLYLKDGNFKDMITDVVIPSDITSIPNGLFYSCQSITSVTIHNNVTSIGYDFCHGCKNLVTVDLGTSVSYINPYAFLGCSKLRTVYCRPMTPPTMPVSRYTRRAFNDVHTDCRFYVPTEAYEAYSTSGYWSDHRNQLVHKDYTEDE